ncbi:MAG: tetratricopeptide repeat protein [Candidatus Marinimicrobia bacterium]|nr:tetratricopeptide repeat protein [Candidatus Neomarinimicrobiota bacterium]
MQYTKAAEYIRKSLDIESGNAVVLEHMGDVLIKLSRDDEAVKYYKKALEIESNNETLKKKLSQQEGHIE